MNWNSRTQLLLGEEGVKKLASSHVLVVGLGGVGAYAAEQLARAGIGKMTIVDCDTVNVTNKNRQLLALDSTVGRPKVEVMAERIRDINPDVEVVALNQYLKDQSIIDLMEQPFDYIVDAIDTLAPKVFLLYYAVLNKQNIVSCMGSGGKLDPSMIQVADIAKSHNCRLAFYVRKRLHRLGIREGITVVFSPEKVADSAVSIEEQTENKIATVGTISYMPAMFGCYCASHVIREILARD
ncbi:MAG: tRNA threonylcarbamoyladenosine dehydratase [Bacteroidales bacterium]|nr:tRNA threonylcarbamoyladenosine dehydratase [Bacteroidales bacterium]MBR2052475.1 tRNA threonylcarbamoyladenosine dehydratase [Bacteroidales bacterium]